jgi:hypothetical protein
MGPFEVVSTNKSRYAMLLTDYATGYITVRTIPRKRSELINAILQEYIPHSANTTGMQMKIFRTDGGKEFVNKLSRTTLEKLGIVHETTCPDTPEQNGLSENNVP